MRDKNVYNKIRALPRMSWSPHNLYNLWQRTFGRLVEDANFTKTNDGLFKQRWKAKRLIRGYHGDFVGETKFKRWYLPASLPDVRARRKHATPSASKQALIANSVQRTRDIEKEQAERAKEEEEAGNTPVGSLFLSELERRLDVVIFRSCLAHSVYQARHMIIRGGVKLNGREHINPNTRMNPGDMVTVDPSRIIFLQTSALLNNRTYGSVMTRPKDEANAAGQGRDDHDAGFSDRGQKQSDFQQKSRSRGRKARLTTPCSIEAHNGSVFHLPPYASPFLFIPAYLEVNFPTCSAVYIRHPTARSGYSEVPTPYDADGELIRLAWEWYSRIRPRMRRKRDLWMSPNQTYGQWPML
ncbi:alpha-L RNA-binding motif-containing protein [Dacryopinax primogenitus]|uniref:Alpha-L RNA-binding motif-containing protein n=1 Tax=Dacryopinax primogenitus (strain DJM 731) TaxID=1858805 RepID=M5FU23_DACPD|nr:alpha-L RNA-binding motif-containing protein [Dacryopinax primogenitus]EJT99668.1 alpha-L RNA-binding motif-containing protein [Dacryopinax primogenitus]